MLGYEGTYEASSLGRIRRVPGVLRSGRRWDGRVLRQRVNRHGYVQVCLSKENKPRTHSIHLLVCSAFYGPRPEGKVIAHGDGNKQNNSASNLRWATHDENEADKRLHGTVAKGLRSGRYTHPEMILRGEDHPMSKLTEHDVRMIRALLVHRFAKRSIAKRFGVSKTTVKDIAIGRTWKTAA